MIPKSLHSEFVDFFIENACDSPCLIEELCEMQGMFGLKSGQKPRASDRILMQNLTKLP
jgi:hypothetical protein